MFGFFFTLFYQYCFIFITFFRLILVFVGGVISVLLMSQTVTMDF